MKRCPITGDLSLEFGPFRILYGPPDPDLELPRFLCIGFKEWNLEFGRIDQEKSGIHLTKFVEGEMTVNVTLLPFESNPQEPYQ